jgi:hypothetical protein
MDERMEWMNADVAMPDDDLEVLVFNSNTEILHLAYHEDGRWIDSKDGIELGGITHWLEVIFPQA